MRNIYLMMRMMLQGTQMSSAFGGIGSARRKRFAGVAAGKQRKLLKQIGIVVALLIYSILIFGSVGKSQAVLFNEGKLAFGEAIINLAFMPLVLSIVMAFMLILNIMYFSNDLELFLVMPVKPGEIVGARLAVSQFSEAMISLVIFLPASLIFCYFSHQSIGRYVEAVISAFLLTTVPVAVFSIIIIIIMRMLCFIKNRERLQMIVNIIFLIGIIVVASLSGMYNSDASTNSATMSTLHGLIAKIPGLNFWAKAIATDNITVKLINWALYIAVTIALNFIAYECGNLFYFRGALGGAAVSARRMKLSRGKLQRSLRDTTLLKALILRDQRMIMRSPTFILSYVLMNFYVPILFYAIAAIALFKSGESIINIRADVVTFFSSSAGQGWLLPTAVGATGIIGFFMGGVSGLAVSSFSREGKGAYMINAWPVDFKTVVMAKLSLSQIYSSIAWILFLIIPGCILTLPWHIVVIGFISGSMGSLGSNMLGLTIDLFRPRLNWESEIQVTKNNLNSLLEMFISFSGAAIIGVVLYFTTFKYRMGEFPAMLVLIALELIFLGAIGLFLKKATSAGRRNLADSI